MEVISDELALKVLNLWGSGQDQEVKSVASTLLKTHMEVGQPPVCSGFHGLPKGPFSTSMLVSGSVPTSSSVTVSSPPRPVHLCPDAATAANGRASHIVGLPRQRRELETPAGPCLGPGSGSNIVLYVSLEG